MVLRMGVRYLNSKVSNRFKSPSIGLDPSILKKIWTGKNKNLIKCHYKEYVRTNSNIPTK